MHILLDLLPNNLKEIVFKSLGIVFHEISSNYLLLVQPLNKLLGTCPTDILTFSLFKTLNNCPKQLHLFYFECTKIMAQFLMFSILPISSLFGNIKYFTEYCHFYCNGVIDVRCKAVNQCLSRKIYQNSSCRAISTRQICFQEKCSVIWLLLFMQPWSWNLYLLTYVMKSIHVHFSAFPTDYIFFYNVKSWDETIIAS